MDSSSEPITLSLNRISAQVAGALALTGVLAFVLVAAATQWLRADLDPLHAPLSFYLLGAYGNWLVVAYWGLALALALLGLGYMLALRHVAGTGLPALLFTAGAVALVLVTQFHTDSGYGSRSLNGLIHNVCAGAAFLCVGVAMLRLSWCLRRAPSWRRRVVPALAMSTLAFVALWLDVLWHLSIRGAEQKVVIVLYIVWLASAAWWLIRRPRWTHA